MHIKAKFTAFSDAKTRFQATFLRMVALHFGRRAVSRHLLRFWCALIIL